MIGPRGEKSGAAVESSDSKAVSETLNADRFSLRLVITYKSKKPRVHQINKLLHLFFFLSFFFRLRALRHHRKDSCTCHMHYLYVSVWFNEVQRRTEVSEVRPSLTSHAMSI